MAKIDIAWLNDEVIADLVDSQEQLDGYVAEVEEEVDALCLTQGNTAVPNIPLDTSGYYKSPILRVLSRLKLKQAILIGYTGSSDGDVDIYEEKASEELSMKIEKWENKITFHSIRIEETVASSSQATTRSIPIGG